MENTITEKEKLFFNEVCDVSGELCLKYNIGLELSKLSESAILRILYFGLNNPIIAKEMAISPYITFCHYKLALLGKSGKKGLFARIYRKKHFNFDDEITKLLHDENPLIRAEATSNPEANENDILFAILDENYGVRSTALKHPKINSEHIKIAMLDTCNSTRMEAVSHPKASKESIKLGLNDEDKLVRQAARFNPNTSCEVYREACINNTK